MITYLKLFNENESHFGFQYKDGFNAIPFDSTVNDGCIEGGLYFTTSEFIIEFLDETHRFIREVKPTDSSLVVSEDGVKLRASALDLGKRHDLHKIETWEWLSLLNVNIDKKGYARILRFSSIIGSLAIAKYATDSGLITEDDFSDSLRWASEFGHLELVKYLLKKGADINHNDNVSVYRAKHCHHQKVVDYLLSNGAFFLNRFVCS